MKSIVFTACIGLGVCALAPGCSANPLVVGRLIEGGSPSACASAGGTCVLNASVACATEAPGSAQDCNTSDITISAAAAARCCFTFRDAAPDRAVGPADAAPDNGDGGGNEGGNSEGANTEDGNNQGGNGEGGGASMCASAGGSCLHNSVQCAGRAPTGAQDCNNPPNPAGDFCCLTVPDAGPDLDAGAADAGLSNDDGANGDGGGTSPLCAAAGGTCINSTVMCGQGAPPTAQDCPFDPLGAYCCITTL